MAFTFLAIGLQAQNPPHPNGGSVPGSGTNIPVGGGAPLDGGLIIMLIAGAAYGSKKIISFRKAD
ncbi:MAG: hypothetical protein KQI35_04790 [Bacteroidetes bacterium]|nr:hypothetical protein [Bacteroidota bacterium]